MLLATLLVACDGGHQDTGEYSGPDDQEIMAGAGYACLLTDGVIECQSNGEMADMGETSPPTARWRSVSHSTSHLCGFTDGGTPACWGWSSSGMTDIPAGLSISSFFLGYENTCALDLDGAVSCWGNEWTGLNEAPAGSFVQAAAAERVACARSDVGAWTCWGAWWGLDETSDGYQFDWTLPDEPLVALEGQSGNLCGLDEDGAIHCWGMTNYGVTHPPDGTGYHNLSVGRRHACVQEADDEVLCWGDLDVWRSIPEGQWLDFDAGTWMDCGIRYGGEIDCWGCYFTDPFDCDWDE